MALVWTLIYIGLSIVGFFFLCVAVVILSMCIGYGLFLGRVWAVQVDFKSKGDEE